MGKEVFLKSASANILLYKTGQNVYMGNSAQMSNLDGAKWILPDDANLYPTDGAPYAPIVLRNKFTYNFLSIDLGNPYTTDGVDQFFATTKENPHILRLNPEGTGQNSSPNYSLSLAVDGTLYTACAAVSGFTVVYWRLATYPNPEKLIFEFA